MNRDETFKKNMPLITYTLHRRFKSVMKDRDDLFQEGCIGLLKAIDNFNPELGYTFSTYASAMIWGQVMSYLRDHSHVIRPPRGEDNLDVRSLDFTVAEGMPLAEIIPAPEDNLDMLIDFELAAQRLSKREQQVISYRMRQGLKQEPIGKILGVSQSQVSRIYRHAVEKVRRAMS